MSSSQARGIDMKLEVVTLPVADVDRAKRFYGDLGWRLDADFVVGDSSARGAITRRARPARSISAPASRRPRRARPADCFSPSPTSRRLAPS